MEIRFTHHAERKFEILKRHGVSVSRKRVVDILQRPAHVDTRSRAPLCIAQGEFDKRRVLRIVYKIEDDMMVVITFYPGRKSQYDH